MSVRKRKPLGPTARFLAKATDRETIIHLPGGKLIVPGHAKTDRGIAGLVTRALAKGKARVVASKK